MKSARAFMCLWACLYGLLALAGPRYIEGQFLVRFSDGVDSKNAKELLSRFQEVESLVPELNLYLVKTGDSQWGERQAFALSLMDEVSYVQKDHYVTRRQLPNDPQFSEQWSLQNNTPGANIQAVEAWGMGQGGEDIRGNEIVIAVVDGGMELTHPDLQPNLWVNSGEIAGNNVDDDENGYVDDVYGWNAYDNNGNIPSDSHGTHVAGIAGASGNNSKQVVGVNWKVKLMAVAGSSGTTSIVARAYGYVMKQKKLWLESGGTRGANIVVTNSSFGVDYGDCTSEKFKVWNDLYDAMGALGILSAAATPNAPINVDEEGDVPTSCSSEYLIAVTNTTREDTKYANAGFGKIHVDLGAPGTGILSTVPGGDVGQKTGTSMATPHVAGAVALLHSQASREFNDLYLTHPSEAALWLKKLLLVSVDPIADLEGVTVSGGRLNLFKAAKAIFKVGFYL